MHLNIHSGDNVCWPPTPFFVATSQAKTTDAARSHQDLASCQPNLHLIIGQELKSQSGCAEPSKMGNFTHPGGAVEGESAVGQSSSIGTMLAAAAWVWTASPRLAMESELA